MKVIRDYIEDMIIYKESLGFARKTYEGYLKDFASYLQVNYSKATFLTEAIVQGWCIQRITETATGFRRRATALREFTKYLFAMGKSDYILSTDSFPKISRYTPYIFSDKELMDIFVYSDRTPYVPSEPCKNLIIAVIYRLIYFCGLRPNEGRELKKCDVDFENETLLIRKNKTHQERIIPMTHDVTELCKNYSTKVSLIYPDTEYFFPSPTEKAYSAKWLTRHFLNLWNQTCGNSNTARVRVYDLRHRYATAIMMKWLDEKVDLYVMLPYLSTYMGHTNLSDTAYYIHLLPEKLLKTSAIDWQKFQKLIPEVCDDE
ncbi:MAG: tyrosine-type recombinase/integrase [Candidatus Theseobacter exili]|nr:tyrosine-type recombinase/integrase [Candidatus Theseobacter exili]